MGRAGAVGAGRVAFDPGTRRRVRRAGARARPLLVPLGLIVAALVLVQARSPDAVVTTPPAGPAVPDGMVLVAVQPSDPAVLGLAVPGSRVDVYAAAGAGALDPLGEVGDRPADLVVRAGLVVAPATDGAAAGTAAAVDPGGSLGPGGGWGGADVGAGALALLVADDEASALASRPGRALLVAVRGGG